MQIGYHNQTYKDQHSKHGRERGESCPGPAIGAALIDSVRARGGISLIETV